MTKVLPLSKYFLRVLIKEPLATFFNFLFPLIWNMIYLFGFGNGLSSGQSYIVFGFVTISMMSLLTITLATIPMLLIGNRINKTLKQFSILKIKKHEYIFSLLVFQLAIFLSFFMFILILYLAIFNLQPVIEIFYFLLISILFFVPLFCLGILIGSLLNTIPMTQALSQLVFFIFLFTSGLFFPLDKMGNWFIYLQKTFPAGNMILVFQQIIYQTPLKDDVFPLIYLIIFTATTIPLSVYFFRFT